MMLFLHQLGLELRKLFGRKRTYIGFGAFLVIELLILVFCQMPGPQRGLRRQMEGLGYGADQYLSGLTMAFQMVSFTVFILGGLYLALVAGDVVAKEVEEKTMRMILCRPVSRIRVLAIKYIACVIYTFSLIGFIGGTAIAIGVAWKGTGGMFAFAPLEGIVAFYSFAEGLNRFLAGLAVLALMLTTVSTLGFGLSCFDMKPAAATIITLSYFFVDMIFRQIPYFQSIKAWFITSHMEWRQVFLPHIPIPQMIEDGAYLMGVNATIVVIAMAVFQQRNFKS